MSDGTRRWAAAVPPAGRWRQAPERPAGARPRATPRRCRAPAGWRRRLSTLAAFTAAAGTALLAGCSTTGTDRLLRAGFDATDAERAIVEHLLASPEIQRATQVLTRSVLDAAMQDLAAPERQAQLHQLAAGFAESVVPVVATAIDKQVLPAVREELAAGLRGAVETAAQAAFDQLLRPDNRSRARALSRDLAASAAGAAAPALSAAVGGGVRAGITRAVAEMLGQVAPPAGAGSAAGAAFDRRLAEAMRAGSQGAFLGLADALHGALGEELRRQQHDFLHDLQGTAATEREAWIKVIGAERDSWLRYFAVLAVIAAVLFLALLAAVLWLNHLLRENSRLRAARTGAG
ncbi:MAG TPA: hypothetical protein VE075_06400 [Thermoanaerobaculia bacterium]|nr:hypothetical protein [Thermoanaerobaculia bacterium]